MNESKKNSEKTAKTIEIGGNAGFLGFNYKDQLQPDPRRAVKSGDAPKLNINFMSDFFAIQK
ncbi:MAG: hypothetical protein LBO08_01920 [Rickettsiales bacterium]|nr:hypothetical protein [Rickettsiales bacterium]